jgi:flavin reductase (DIM6/NTAB) family NADH-FMN oxidoreductase RutF
VFSAEAPLPFIGNFGFRSGREQDKFAKCDYQMTDFGLPFVTEYTVAAVEVAVTASVEVRTHKLFIGEAKSARLLSDAFPLTYMDYHKIKKGKSHVNAPSFVFNNLKNA